MKKLTLFTAFVVAMAMSLYADCGPVNVTWLQTSQTDLGEMTTDNSAVWTYDADWHYAKGKGALNKTGWLLSPAMDLTNATSVTLSFTHVHNYCGNPEEELTLWVTNNYADDVESTTWQQLTIDPYASNTAWKPWVDVTINVPTSAVGAKTVFGFKYMSTETNNGTWEIKNVNLIAIVDCAEGEESEYIKVCGQNLRNYYYNYSWSSRPEYSTDAGFAKKTNSIVTAVITINADIYAFCELEAKPIILTQLADSINKRLGKNRFKAVSDGIDYTQDSYDNHLKSGFIYRSDRVKPVGENTAASTDPYYYGNTMRIQAFEDLNSGERFVLSMNHFKAKTGDGDQGASQRVTNATHLLNALKKVSIDPDILVLGDLNCTTDEEPIQKLINAGYAEQLQRFDYTAYSHCYSGSGNLIDHALANSSMAKQVVNAQVLHTCTTCEGHSSNSYTSYSDHDPYYVELQLGTGVSTCEDIDEIYLETGGTDYDLGAMTEVSVSGSYKWKYRSSYGATCQDKGGEDWLLMPAKNLSKMKSVNVSFDHAINYANVDRMSTEMTMWVTPNFDNVQDSEWQQITIPVYPSGTSWDYVSTSVAIPTKYVGKNTVIAFKYNVPSDSEKSPNWEIKNLRLTASCTVEEDLDPQNPSESIDMVKDNKPGAVMLIENNRLVIMLPNGTKYDILGTRVE